MPHEAPIYATAYGAVVVLLLWRAQLRWHQRMSLTSFAIVFLAINYLALASYWAARTFGIDIADIIASPASIMMRTIPIIVLLWLSRRGEESL